MVHSETRPVTDEGEFFEATLTKHQTTSTLDESISNGRSGVGINSEGLALKLLYQKKFFEIVKKKT